jgi:hypothetical protein
MLVSAGSFLLGPVLLCFGSLIKSSMNHGHSVQGQVLPPYGTSLPPLHASKASSSHEVDAIHDTHTGGQLHWRPPGEVKARGPVTSGCNRWPGAIHHTRFCTHPYVLPWLLFGSLLGVFCSTRICSHAPCLFLQSSPLSLTSWLIGLRWSSPSLSRTCMKGVQKGMLAPSQPGCVLEETVQH